MFNRKFLMTVLIAGVASTAVGCAGDRMNPSRGSSTAATSGPYGNPPSNGGPANAENSMNTESSNSADGGVSSNGNNADK